MKTVAIVQARMGSKRLPGKVLLPLAGKPVLTWVVERLRLAKTVDEIVIATTTDPSDDPLELFCSERGLQVFRGHETDVLDRYYHAAQQFMADRVVRITSDCPLIDPTVVDTVTAAFQSGDDYVSNIRSPQTYPNGLDVEVFSQNAIVRSWKEDKNPEWREHVDEYVLHHPELFQIRDVRFTADHSQERWTLDTSEDAAFLEQILSHLNSTPDFTWHDVLALLDKNPHWRDINKHVPQIVV